MTGVYSKSFSYDYAISEASKITYMYCVYESNEYYYITQNLETGKFGFFDDRERCIMVLNANQLAPM